MKEVGKMDSDRITTVETQQYKDDMILNNISNILKEINAIDNPKLKREDFCKKITKLIMKITSHLESLKDICLWQYRNAEDCNEKVHSLAIKKALLAPQ